MDHEKRGYSAGRLNNHGAVELSPGGQLVRSYPTTDHTPLSSTLVNGGFEISQPHAWLKGDLLNETLPPGTQADMTYDTKVKHTGKSSGRISWLSSKPHLFLFFEQDIAVQAGRTYTFTGWLKTKNVVACSGCDFGKGTQAGDSAVYVIQFIKPGPYTPPAAQIRGASDDRHDPLDLTLSVRCDSSRSHRRQDTGSALWKGNRLVRRRFLPVARTMNISAQPHSRNGEG